MIRLFNKKIRTPGLPPGFLPENEEVVFPQVRLAFIEYSEDRASSKQNATLDECVAHLETPAMTWIQVYGVHDVETISEIGKRFHLHPLVMEDIMTAGQRPKLDVYGDQIFVVTRLLRYDTRRQKLRDDQVSLVFGTNYLISFLERDEDVFQPIEERIQKKHHRLAREGSDYLAYTILDMVVDYYFSVLEATDVQIDHLEEELTGETPVSGTVKKIQTMKREMIVLRKAIWPMRDVINRLIHLDHPLLSAHTQIYLRDIYDHTVQTMDIIEGFRDVIASMLDLYLSSINIRTNEIMKVLTIVSTIFVPLTFIASVYGMNLDHIPGQHGPHSYLLVGALMVSVTLIMLFYFYKRRWI